MFRKTALLQTLLSLSCLACGGLVEARIELVIDEKLTLEEVFKAGFRPSSVTTSNMGDIRVWERQSIDLLFGDFRYSIDSENTTFTIYDDDQIESLSIIASREAPITFKEAERQARDLSDRLGMDAYPHVDEWLKRCRARNSMVIQGFGGKDWRPGVRVTGEFLTTLQRLDQLPAVMSIKVQWKYLGSGPKGGNRWGKPIVSPAGYDWDMSHEAWSARVRKGENTRSEQPRATPPDATPEGALDPVEKSRSDGNKPEVQSVPETPESWGPKWIVLLIISMVLGILAFIFIALRKNSR